MSATHLGNHSSTAAASSYSFSGADLGAAHASRHIVAAISAEDAVAGAFGVTSASIGGVAASTVVEREDTTNGMNSYIVIAAVPTGATGDVAVSFTGNHNNCFCALYRVTGLASGAAHATASDAGDPIATTIEVPANGLVIGCATMDNDQASTPTGIAELYDQSFDGNRVTGGMSQNLAAETARSVGFNGGGACSGSFASWRVMASLVPPATTQAFLTR